VKGIIKILEDKKIEQILKHMPAKDAPVLTEEEQSDVDAFMEAWDQHWLDSADTSRSVEADGFHPSSLGISVGKCGRRNVYLLRGVEKKSTFPPRILRVFGNGHAVHDRLQESLEGMDIGMQSEGEVVSEEPPIRGHYDGIIMWRDREILIEIKSCSPTVFENRLQWKKPKDEHFEQANIYAHVLGLDVIWIIYENKATQELKIFEKKADRKKSQKIIDRWHAEWLCFKDGELPERPYKPESPVCGGCDLKTHCFSDPEKGVDLKPYKAEVKIINTKKEQE
jgi:hypothetical protein